MGYNVPRESGSLVVQVRALCLPPLGSGKYRFFPGRLITNLNVPLRTWEGGPGLKPPA